MDPLSVTVAAMVAAASKSVGERAGREAWDVLGRLTEAVRSRLYGDKFGYGTLAALEQAPDEEARVTAVAREIERHMAGDSGFRDELVRLLEEARGDPRVGSFVTEVYSNAQVGKIVNIGHARDVSF